MARSMWTYPWDVQDLGLPTVERDLRERAGLDMISLATSYHAGRFLQARSPLRKAWFPEDGTLYFRPDPKRWEDSRIKPKMADVVEGGDVLAELVKRRDAGGLGVSCWTVCLHNTRLGMLHPETVTRNAFGDPNYYNLCPSNPDARAYVRAVVADVSHGYRPDRIELESPCFMGFATSIIMRRTASASRPRTTSCWRSASATTAWPPPAPTASTPTVSERSCAAGSARLASARHPPAVSPASRPAAPRPSPPGRNSTPMCCVGTAPVTSLVAELREATHPDTSVVMLDIRDGWLGGCDLAAIAAACDGAVLCAYDMTPDEVADLGRAGRAAVGPDKFLGLGFRLFYPEMTGRGDLQARVGAALSAGADGLNFYNYGLVPAARLDWIR